MNLVDWIIVLLIAAGAWQGYRRGLISTAGGIFGFFAGLWLAGAYYLPLAAFLGKRLGLEKLLTAVLIPLCAGVPAGSEALPVFTGAGWGEAGSSHVPSPLWAPLVAMQSGMLGITRAHLLAGAVVKAVAFFMILGCVYYAVGIAAGVLTRVAHLLFLGGLNRLAGLGLGLLERALVLTLAVGMLTPLVFGFAINSPDPGVADSLMRAWQTSLLIPYFMWGWNAAVPVLQQFFHII